MVSVGGQPQFEDSRQSTRVARTGPPDPASAPVAYAISAVLLASAFVALLWVPTYAHLTPSIGGIPFFYWYSLLWLLVNALCQAVAYQLLGGIWILQTFPAIAVGLFTSSHSREYQ